MYKELVTTITLPESEEECASVHPHCEECGHFLVKECPGDRDVFTEIYKPSDIERLRPVLKEYFDKKGMGEVTD